jgi:hypothetical protein
VFRLPNGQLHTVALMRVGHFGPFSVRELRRCCVVCVQNEIIIACRFVAALPFVVVCRLQTYRKRMLEHALGGLRLHVVFQDLSPTVKQRYRTILRHFYDRAMTRSG